MAERLKREDARFKYATDADIWLCLCFLTEEDYNAFLALTGLPRRKFVTGDELRAVTQAFRPQKRRRGFPKGQLLPIDDLPDLFEAIPYDELSGEKACLMEAELVL